MVDDNDIMCRVQAGQTHLFDELVRRYRPALERVALGKLGDRAWAEDVVQEAFLAAYTARKAFNPAYAYRTWQWTILLNLCRRHWQRRAGRPQEHSLSFAATRPANFREPAVPECGLGELLVAEQREQLHHLLTRLPEVEGDAICLRFLGGLPFAEMALAMDCSLGAAKQRVKRGLTNLAALLREESGELP